jgi:hypothetical protein
MKVAMWLALAALLVAAQQDDASRQIWDNYFGASRLPSKTAPSSAPAPRPAPQYRRVSQPPTSKQVGKAANAALTQNARGAALGVTIWKMESPVGGDGARLLVQEGAGRGRTEYIPHRLEAGTTLREGDLVRLAIETPSDGWLYVIDQEVHTGDNVGPPYLIFPTTGSRNGDNRVGAARLVEIPAREDKVNVFTIRPTVSGERGERLTILFTPQPIPGITPMAGPQELNRATFESWMTQFRSDSEHFELVDGLGQSWSIAEKTSGEQGRPLTLDDPAPQTVFVFPEKAGKPVLATVLLRVAG